MLFYSTSLIMLKIQHLSRTIVKFFKMIIGIKTECHISFKFVKIQKVKMVSFIYAKTLLFS